VTVTNANPNRAAFVAAIALLLLGIGAWFVFVNSEPRVDPIAAPTRHDDAEGAVRETTAPEQDATIGANATAREPAEEATPTLVEEDGEPVTVRLHGLDPELPWTTPIRLALFGGEDVRRRFHERFTAELDSEGHAVFALPRRWFETQPRWGTVTATNDGYLEARRRIPDDLAPGSVIDLEVRATARIEGRVVDAHGNPVVATFVRLFPLRAGEPLPEAVASTWTDEDGRFRATMLPTPVRLLAVAMSIDGGIRKNPNGGLRAVTEGARADLRPASIDVTTLRTAKTTTLADLVLAENVVVAGTLLWDDGEAVRRAALRTRILDGQTLHADRATSVVRTPNGRMATETTTTTDAKGAFELPFADGTRLELCVIGLMNMDLLGEPRFVVSRGEAMSFTLPSPLTLRATRNGEPVDASFETAAGGWLRPDRNGDVDVVVMQPTKVRAAFEGACSEWIHVTPEQAGTESTVELVHPRGLVRIECDTQLHSAVIEWRGADGRQGRYDQPRTRDRDVPFVWWTEPGRYHLRICASDDHLIPFECNVDVGSEPAVVRLPAIRGGRFTVFATDASGIPLPGTCRVTDAAGREVRGVFVRKDRANEPSQPGVLPAGAATFDPVVPPGDYDLLLDFGAFGMRRERVTVRPYETIEVRVQL